MKLSVVIPTFNRSSLIDLTLKSFLNQSFPQEDFEILVVDNASRDDTKSVVKKWQEKSGGRIRYIFEGRQGVHYARNTGAVNAQADVLYFTDDDMLADPKLLETLYQEFISIDGLGAASGKILPKWGAKPPEWILELCNNHLLSLSDRGDETIVRDQDFCVYSCHQMVKKSLVLECGGFHPENTDGVWVGDGETGMNLKIQDKGYKFAYVGKSVIHHIIPESRLNMSYLRSRLANQGNCDSYTFFQRERPSRLHLVKDVFVQFGQIFKRIYETIKYLVQGRSRWRLSVGYIHYHLNRIKYEIKLIVSADWRAFVLRDNWIS